VVIGEWITVAMYIAYVAIICYHTRLIEQT